MVSCCKLLGVRSFVLEVRSWSGHDVPVASWDVTGTGLQGHNK